MQCFWAFFSLVWPSFVNHLFQFSYGEIMGGLFPNLLQSRWQHRKRFDGMVDVKVW